MADQSQKLITPRLYYFAVDAIGGHQSGSYADFDVVARRPKKYSPRFACTVLAARSVETVLLVVLASAWPTTTVLYSATHRMLQTYPARPQPTRSITVDYSDHPR